MDEELVVRDCKACSRSEAERVGLPSTISRSPDSLANRRTDKSRDLSVTRDLLVKIGNLLGKSLEVLGGLLKGSKVG